MQKVKCSPRKPGCSQPRGESCYASQNLVHLSPSRWASASDHPSATAHPSPRVHSQGAPGGGGGTPPPAQSGCGPASVTLRSQHRACPSRNLMPTSLAASTELGKGAGFPSRSHPSTQLGPGGAVEPWASYAILLSSLSSSVICKKGSWSCPPQVEG